MTRALFAIAVLGSLALAAMPTAAQAQRPDTDAWDRVLRRYARQGGVDYAGLKADAAARADLDRFVRSAGAMRETEPLASWLNAYNALVVSAIVSRVPMRGGVQQVPGFFNRIRYRVAGRMRTLDELENQIIRPRFHDARVHAALNCGARSCPPLESRAFRQSSVDATLTRLARAMVASNRHVEARSGRLALSSIFDWFRSDFERDGGGTVAGWVRRYDATGKLRGLPSSPPISFKPYDWRLNEASR